MDLENKRLKLLDGGIWSDDVEEALIVSYEVRCLDVIVAVHSMLASDQAFHGSLYGLHCGHSLIRHVCCRGSIKYCPVESTGYDCQYRIFVRHP